MNPDMVAVMQEKGIDMEFRGLRSFDEAISYARPDIIVTFDCSEQVPEVPGAQVLDWELADPNGKPLDVMRDVRDDIEKRVTELIHDIT